MRPYYYLGRDRALTQLSNGLPFFVHTGDRGIAVWIVLGGTWENFVDDILCALARPGDTFVDVGANLGYYTVKIGNLVGRNGRVFSFEPNPELFAVLSANIEINGFGPRTTAVNCAAGSAPGSSVLHFDYANMGGGHVDVPGDETIAAGVPVEIRRVDDVVPAECHAHLIKVDAEGFEPLVFAGMTALLARSPRAAIVMEVMAAAWKRYGEPAEQLRTLAGPRQPYLITHQGRLMPLEWDGLDSATSAESVSYVLLIAPDDDRMAAILPFIGDIPFAGTAPADDSAAPRQLSLQDPEGSPPAAPMRNRSGGVHFRTLVRQLKSGATRILRAGPVEAPIAAEGLPKAPFVSHAVAPFVFRSDVCRTEHFDLPLYSYWCAAMKETPRLHRKQWEYVYITQALHERGMLTEGRSGIGFAVGSEPLPSLFAARGCTILASDLEPDEAMAAGWVQTNQHAASLSSLNGRNICDPIAFGQRVRFRFVDMRAPDADLSGFDFCWSSCALEHLGSIDAGLQFVHDSIRCLRPGGIAVHTTELNISEGEDTLDEGGTVLFRARHIRRLAEELRSAGHKLEPLNLATGHSPVDRYVDVPPYLHAPHLRLLIGQYASTSVGLIVRRAE